MYGPCSRIGCPPFSRVVPQASCVPHDGQMVLQKRDTYGDSTPLQYLMNGNGGESLNDAERSLMHLVLTNVCLNGPVVRYRDLWKALIWLPIACDVPLF